MPEEFAQTNNIPFIGFGQMFLFLGSLIIVIIAAIYVTRFIATQRFRLQGKNIRIIESIGMGQNTSLSIIRVGNKNILIGVTKENINHIQTLDEEDIDLSHLQNDGQNVSFSRYLEKFIAKKENVDKDDETV